MKRVLLAAALLGPAAAGAATMESLGANADRSFFLAPLAVRPSVQAAAELSWTARQAQTQVQLTPVFRALRPGERLGSEYGRVNLAAQLDRNLFLMKETLGTRLLDIGLAADAGAKTRFLTFTDGAGTTLGAIGSLSDLRGKGVDVRIDASTVYNFRIEVGSIFDDPVHKSILHTTPTAGTRGPSYHMTTGALLTTTRAKSAVISVDGDEYWIFYGRDALTNGSGFADTRGFLITHEAGMSTKAWPVAESSLPVDAPTVVDLGGVQLQMTRTSGGELIVGSAN
jgi:hypothetical protein